MQRVLKDSFEFHGYRVRIAPDGRKRRQAVFDFQAGPHPPWTSCCRRRTARCSPANSEGRPRRPDHRMLGEEAWSRTSMLGLNLGARRLRREALQPRGAAGSRAGVSPPPPHAARGGLPSATASSTGPHKLSATARRSSSRPRIPGAGLLREKSGTGADPQDPR